MFRDVGLWFVELSRTIGGSGTCESIWGALRVGFDGHQHLSRGTADSRG